MGKHCKDCGELKEFSEYYKKRKKSLESICKECKSKRSKDIRLDIKSRVKQIPEFKVCTKCKQTKTSKEFSKCHTVCCGLKSRCKVCREQESKQYRNTTERKYIEYMRGALRRGIEFCLNESEFSLLYNGQCYYCGTSPAKGADRLDSDVGYAINNCKPCCSICNIMKHLLSFNDFTSHAQKIAQFMSLQ